MKKQSPTILVVEDDPNDQFMLTRGFKKIGVTTPIHLVGNGQEAIAYMMAKISLPIERLSPTPLLS